MGSQPPAYRTLRFRSYSSLLPDARVRSTRRSMSESGRKGKCKGKWYWCSQKNVLCFSIEGHSGHVSMDIPQSF